MLEPWTVAHLGSSIRANFFPTHPGEHKPFPPPFRWGFGTVSGAPVTPKGSPEPGTCHNNVPLSVSNLPPPPSPRRGAVESTCETELRRRIRMLGVRLSGGGPGLRPAPRSALAAISWRSRREGRRGTICAAKRIINLIIIVFGSGLAPSQPQDPTGVLEPRWGRRQIVVS